MGCVRPRHPDREPPGRVGSRSTSSGPRGSSARCAGPSTSPARTPTTRRRSAGRPPPTPAHRSGARSAELPARVRQFRRPDRRLRPPTQPEPGRLALAPQRTRPLAARDHPDRRGHAGSNGWFVSDVSVSWDVHDASRPSPTGRVRLRDRHLGHRRDVVLVRGDVRRRDGAETSIVRRDMTAPTVTCGTPAPVFEIYQLGARVTGVGDGCDLRTGRRDVQGSRTPAGPARSRRRDRQGPGRQHPASGRVRTRWSSRRAAG